MSKSFLLGIIATLNLVFAEPLFADAELERLKQQRNLIRNQISQLDVLKDYYQVYTSVRDTDLLGSNGIRNLGESWDRRALQWLEKWTQIQAQVSLHSVLDTGQFHSLLNIDLLAQTTGLKKLKEEAEEIEKIIASSARRMRTAVRPQLSLLAQDGPELKRAVEITFQAVDGFVENLEQLGGLYRERYERLETLHHPSYSAILNKTQTETLSVATPDLRSSIQDLMNLITFNRDLYPLVQDLLAKDVHLRAETITFGIFHMLKAAQELDDLCRQVKAAFAASSLPESLIAREVLRPRQICDAQQNRARIAQAPKGPFIVRYRENRIQKYGQRCQNGDPELNCQFYAIIARISPEQILSMNEDHLKNYEFSWDLVESNR